MSISNDIIIEYTWDRDTVLNASYSAYRYEMRHSPKRFIGWIFIVLTQFSVVGAMQKDAIGLLIISTILTTYWYFFRWSIRKFILSKSFDMLENANHKFKITVNRERLLIDEISSSWSDIREIVSLEDGFLIYYKESFIFFPSKAFKSIEDKNRFSLLAKEMVVKYKKEL